MRFPYLPITPSLVLKTFCLAVEVAEIMIVYSVNTNSEVATAVSLDIRLGGFELRQFSADIPATYVD